MLTYYKQFFPKAQTPIDQHLHKTVETLVIVDRAVMYLPLFCVIYSKSLEIRQKSQENVWFHDLRKRVRREDGSALWDGESEVWRVEFRFKGEALHELKEDRVFHGIENAGDLPERLEALWTYATGHAGVAADGLPDGWLRYTVPSSDTNIARWSVHPAWFALQAAYCSSEVQVNDTPTGEVTSVPASSIGSLIRERVRQVNIEQLVRQISGCTSTLSAWLGGKQDDLPVGDCTIVCVCGRIRQPESFVGGSHEDSTRTD